MLCWILIVGGLLIMMGRHDRSEALFYYFRLSPRAKQAPFWTVLGRNPRFEPLYILWPYLTTSEQQMVVHLMRSAYWRKEGQPHKT